MTYPSYGGIEWSRPRTTLMAGRRSPRPIVLARRSQVQTDID